jgi:hypothetical protein
MEFPLWLGKAAQGLCLGVAIGLYLIVNAWSARSEDHVEILCF